MAWAQAADTPRTSKELFDYIQEARKLGLKDEQIQKNALRGGWDQVTIEQTFAIVRLLNNEKLPKGAAFPNPAVVPEGYRIGAGDVLQIVVWKEVEASVPEVVVRADGKISVPLINEVEAAGYTPQELEKILVERLGKYIINPVVTVIAKEVRSKRVYLVGAVRREGPIPLLRPMTVLQAINEAGGLAEYAKKKRIYVLRNENGRQVKRAFDYQAVIRGEHLEQNIQVLPDDTIIVPQ
jgi:polysaccharide export outer membrane protein